MQQNMKIAAHSHLWLSCTKHYILMLTVEKNSMVW